MNPTEFCAESDRGRFAEREEDGGDREQPERDREAESTPAARSGRRRCRDLRRVELRVVQEDRAFHVPQRLRGLEAELLDERLDAPPAFSCGARRPGGRSGTARASADREKALSQRMLTAPAGLRARPPEWSCRPRVEVGSRCGPSTRRALRLEPLDLGAGHGLERQAGERGSTPELQGLSIQRCRQFGDLVAPARRSRAGRTRARRRPRRSGRGQYPRGRVTIASSTRDLRSWET